MCILSAHYFQRMPFCLAGMRVCDTHRSHSRVLYKSAYSYIVFVLGAGSCLDLSNFLCSFEINFFCMKHVVVNILSAEYETYRL